MDCGQFCVCDLKLEVISQDVWSLSKVLNIGAQWRMFVSD